MVVCLINELIRVILIVRVLKVAISSPFSMTNQGEISKKVAYFRGIETALELILPTVVLSSIYLINPLT